MWQTSDLILDRTFAKPHSFITFKLYFIKVDDSSDLIAPEVPCISSIFGT